VIRKVETAVSILDKVSASADVRNAKKPVHLMLYLIGMSLVRMTMSSFAL